MGQHTTIEINQVAYLISYLSEIFSPYEVESLKKFTSRGLVDTSTLFEYIYSKIHDLEMVKAPTHDLICRKTGRKIEAKLRTPRFNSYGKSYGVNIEPRSKAGSHRKEGDIVSLVLEPMTRENYFFYIPEKEHQKVALTSNIEIPFNIDGTPRRIPLKMKRLPNWWEFEKTEDEFWGRAKPKALFY